jgi:hypothetical protein
MTLAFDVSKFCVAITCFPFALKKIDRAFS